MDSSFNSSNVNGSLDIDIETMIIIVIIIHINIKQYPSHFDDKVIEEAANQEREKNLGHLDEAN